MRIRVAVSTVFLFVAMAAPLVAHGQFTQPTKEELQMTSDPQAPGAAAVYLYREEKTDDTLHYHELYVRMKILTEKGKEQATRHIPYMRGNFKVTDIQGRTIHPDGTVIPLTAKPADLVDVKNAGYQLNEMVFTLPSVEVGSIIEYRLQERYSDDSVQSPDWYVQQQFFVHKAHYFFLPSSSDSITDEHGTICGNILYAQTAGMDAKVVRDAAGRFTLDVVNVPPIPNEQWMPPLNSVVWRVHFYYSWAYNGKDFWTGTGKRWLKDTNRFANPTGTLKAAASQLVAASDTDEVKAKKLYDAVQKLDNTDFTRAKTAAELKAEGLKANKNAEIVWNQKSGSSNDLAMLYVALARAAGLTAYPMQVVNRDVAIFDGNYLSDYQLDDYIAVLELNGKEVYVDPGEKMCPFGLLAWKHTLAGGMRQSDKGVTYGATPATTYVQNVVERIGQVTIAPDGSLTGMVRLVMTGQDAMHWRQVALRNDPEEVKKQFTDWVRGTVPDGVIPEMDHFVGLDDYNVNLIAVVKVHGIMGTGAGKHYFMPGLFFDSRSENQFAAQDQRQIPVDVHYAKKVIDQVTYHLPAGLTVESAPQSTSVPWQGNAVMKIVSKTNPDGVTVAHELAYNYTLVDAKDYALLHGFFQKVDAADQQQIALVRVPAGGTVTVGSK
ncbi:MAG: DUF3857 domain-containing protein [Acidobacteriota bacterium]